MACQYCELVKTGKKLYEDEKAAILLHSMPAVPGHMLIVPKQHIAILEQVPQELLKHLSALTNKASNVLFEQLKAHGTNVVIENGTAAQQQIPHFAINVVPRIEGDGLNLQWQPKKLSDEQMSMAELQLKEQAKSVVVEEEKKEPIRIEDTKAKEEVVKKEDYLTKQLRRLP